MKRKPTIEEQIIQGLESFAEAVKRDEITTRFTCRKVVLDLQPTEYKPALIKNTRDVLKMSQALFARFLGVSPATVRAWEQGTKTPSPIACRFMDEIRRDPARFLNRFREMMTPRKKRGQPA